MVLRVVARPRITRLARSADRDPPRRSGAGDPARVRRGAACQHAVEPDQRAERTTARRYPLRADLQRQFRIGHELLPPRSPEDRAWARALPSPQRNTNVKLVEPPSCHYSSAIVLSARTGAANGSSRNRTVSM